MNKINFLAQRSFAKEMDDADTLAHFRNDFFFPKINNQTAIYFCGNSLGLQPKSAKNYIDQELKDWQVHGVEGHFEAKRPWFKYHSFFTDALTKIVGAKKSEVVAMNSLTVNLHLLLLSFYKPTQKRFKILMEAGAFPSDMYAIETQVKFYGFNPKTAIIEIAPRKNEHCINEEDIFSAIEKNKDSLALVMMGGVNYYTGQLFDLEKITKVGQKAGAKVGFDLAHAVGNVPLELNKWKVDFACWCSYKYLNSGPGAVGGIFVNENHVQNPKTFRLAGWWGHDEKTRFKMEKGFMPMPTAESWQMSNAQVFNMAAHLASLEIFEKAGMTALRQKSVLLTSFLYFLLENIKTENPKLAFEIITPNNEMQRGAQLSLLFHKNGKKFFKLLQQNNVIADWREPNVIRIAPTPLYNSFEDVFTFYAILKTLK